MAVEKTKKKLTVERIDLAKQKAGFAFAGKYIGVVVGEPFQELDKKTGELVTRALSFAIFEQTSGARIKVIQDVGFRSAMTDAMVKEGMNIEIVKREKTTLSRDRTMNQYDIFAL